MDNFKLGKPHWWQGLTVLSLDAPLVACVWQTLFARILNVELPWPQPVLLGLAVWVVYAADRWIEGWRLSPETVLTQRHHFYMLWRWPVFAVGLAVVLAGLGLAMLRLPRSELAASGVVAGLTLAYLLANPFLPVQQAKRLPKELCIAALFPAGTALAPVMLALPSVFPWQSTEASIIGARLTALWIPLGLFGLLCLANLVLISAWEREVDARHGQTSIALQLSHRLGWMHALPWLVSVLGFIAAASSHGWEQTTGVCAGVSGLLLGGLDYMEPRIGRQAARALVDLTLLTPAVVVFCA